MQTLPALHPAAAGASRTSTLRSRLVVDAPTRMFHWLFALAPHEFGTLIDPLDGRADLANGHIRILHAASFHDDPTRLLRAIRYAARFSADGLRPFDLAPETAGPARSVRSTATIRTTAPAVTGIVSRCTPSATAP